MANYEAFRAMYEGRNAQMFKGSTGMLTWMSHPAQPSFVWQLYHYDLEPNAALYAVKKAAEMVHVQLNEANGAIEVVNNRMEEIEGGSVVVTIYRADSTVDSRKSYAVEEVAGSSVVKVAQIEIGAAITPVYFVKLDLNDKDGKLLSTNFYWQSLVEDDFTGLKALPTAMVGVGAVSRAAGDRTVVTVTLRNSSPAIALMTHVQLHRKTSGKRVLPVFYSDNYLSLVPGESRVVTVEFATKDLGGERALIEVDGFNVDVTRSDGVVSIGPNLNALPGHWPASGIVALVK